MVGNVETWKRRWASRRFGGRWKPRNWGSYFGDTTKICCMSRRNWRAVRRDPSWKRRNQGNRVTAAATDREGPEAEQFDGDFEYSRNRRDIA